MIDSSVRRWILCSKTGGGRIASMKDGILIDSSVHRWILCWKTADHKIAWTDQGILIDSSVRRLIFSEKYRQSQTVSKPTTES